MQRSRLLWFALATAAWGLFAGCEADEPPGPRVGTAEFGPGGSSYAGFAAGDSGPRGGAGCVGSGCAGNRGAGGVTGSAGRAGSNSAGGGAGAAVGNGAYQLCEEACKVDADCVSLLAGEDFRCNASAQRCEGFASPCRNDAECVPGASQWLWNCSSDDDCFFFDDDVCVAIADVGRCARSAPSSGCLFPVPDAIPLPKFGAGGTVVVCADTSQKCSEGNCIVACASDEDCAGDIRGSVCDESTGACVCGSDIDCGTLGVSRCNTTARRCECVDDDDCNGIPNTDKCIAGRCGCSSLRRMYRGAAVFRHALRVRMTCRMRISERALRDGIFAAVVTELDLTLSASANCRVTRHDSAIIRACNARSTVC